MKYKIIPFIHFEVDLITVFLEIIENILNV